MTPKFKESKLRKGKIANLRTKIVWPDIKKTPSKEILATETIVLYVRRMEKGNKFATKKISSTRSPAKKIATTMMYTKVKHHTARSREAWNT